MKNIEKVVSVLEDVFPGASVVTESYSAVISQNGFWSESSGSPITCYKFGITTKQGANIPCCEWYTNDYFNGMSLKALKLFFEERCTQSE